MALQGFDKAYYLGEKLAALQATESEWVGKTTDFLETVLSNVYGLTAEEHYMQYGWQEGLAPNQYFNAEEYKLAKAQQLFDGGNYLTVESALAAFEDAWQQDPYQHYIQYGAGESINPSNDFDASQYFADKLAQLQASDPDTYGDWTADQVEAAFFDAGLTAVEHFMLYGQDEGLTVTVVPADEQVNAGDSTPTAGEVFTLTTGIDDGADFTGGAGNDTFKAVVDGTTAANATLTALDSLDGGAGNDVLNINNISALANDKTDLSVATIKNIETINIQAVGDISNIDGASTAGIDEVDFSSISGLTTVNTTKSVDTLVKAAATTDVNVSGATGFISVIGGKDVAVTDATAAKAITVGNIAAGGDAAGSITVTDTNNTGANAIVVEGGTDVNVTTTADKANSGTITVGDATNGMASGAVVVTQNSTSNGTAMTAGNVTATGGTTIDITANMTNTAVKGGGANAITAGTYAAVAGNTTTDVTITQNASAIDFANDATAAVKETSVVTFKAMASGETLIINGLTFTAAKALTAEEVAEAFAGLTAADTQDAGGPVANGIYTGTFNSAVWTSSAASGATVTFTAQDDDEPDLVFTGTATTNDAGARIPTQVKTAGTAAGASTAVDVTADYGNVTVDDNATASITTVTVDGYDTATIGNTAALTALTTVNLSNSSGANVIDNGATASALTLNLNKITGATDIDNGAASVTDLTVNTSGTASATALTAAALKNLTVNAAANLTVTPTSIAALETLTVTGAGNVTMGDISAATKTITAGTATGNISATVDGTKATVTTGDGNDSITVDTATQTKAINLGAGDDTLTYSTATMGVPTGATAGGDGTDTVAMTFASAQALDGNTNFATAITGFERLTITDQAVMAANADITIDLEALGFDYVTLAAGTDDTEGTAANKLILDKMANDGTLVMNATQSTTAAQASTQVNILDAATGTTDVLNLVVSAEASVDAKTVVANNVETFNITATDVFLDNGSGKDTNDATHTLVASGDKVTSVVVTGDDLILDTDSTVLTSVDASAMTGGIAYTADGAAAGTTVMGGQGVDKLIASGSNDVLNGGAGDDTLTGANLTELWGGDGADTFVMNTPTNVNSYSTITDLEAGDVIEFTAGSKFVSSAIELGDTAVFQDYANATVKALDDNGNDVAWFEFSGNTYIIESGDAVADDFVAGTDSIIKVAGVVDLSTASYNLTDGTLEIA